MLLRLLLLGVCIAIAAAADCTFTDGNFNYDLSPLTRSGGSYVARDLKGNKYYMNVCAKVGNVPTECSQFSEENAAVFKVTVDGGCTYIGKDRDDRELFVPLEDGAPKDGLELHYIDGEPCANTYGEDMGISQDSGSVAKAAHFRFRFFCKAEVDNMDEYKNYPVVEYSRSCRYSVIWPTKYACPNGSFGPGLTGGWKFILVVAFLAAFYVGGGIGFNVMRLKLDPGFDAHPHIHYWRMLPGLVTDGVSFTTQKIKELTSRKDGSMVESQYQPVADG
jgi:hypothetical protein